MICEVLNKVDGCKAVEGIVTRNKGKSKPKVSISKVVREDDLENEFKKETQRKIETSSEFSPRNDGVPLKPEKLLELAHRGHPGVAAMHLLLKNHAWDGKNKDIRNFVSSCNFCLTKGKPKKHILKGIRSDSLGEVIAIDLAINVGENKSTEVMNLFIATELLSGMCFLELLVGKESDAVKACLIKGLGLLGKPRIIISDNSKEFQGCVSMWLKEESIAHWKIHPGKPHANIAERKIKTTKKLMRSSKCDQVEDQVSFAQFYLNHLPSTRSGVKPIDLMQGLLTTSITNAESRRLMDKTHRVDMISMINAKKDKALKRINKTRSLKYFDQGDSVWAF